MMTDESERLRTQEPDSPKRPLIFRGRLFSSDEIAVVVSCTAKYFNSGRTAISRAVCEELNWKQPNGWLKDRACRDAMRQMEAAGLITLPAPLVKKNVNKQDKPTKTRSLLLSIDLSTPLSEMPRVIDFDLAKGSKSERIWNELVEKYHYLGHKVIVGRCLKYLVKGDGRIIGALAFSSPAWHLEARDATLKDLGVAKEEILDKVINNSRFLILPHINVKNLASRILSNGCERVAEDWSWYYSVKPVIVETFVQPSLYLGTCYKAANWVEIGQTKGYAKKGLSHHNSQEPKGIYLYGLNKDTRKRLREAVLKQLEAKAGELEFSK